MFIYVGEIVDKENEIFINVSAIEAVQFQDNDSIVDKCLVYMKSGKVWTTNASAYKSIVYAMGELE